MERERRASKRWLGMGGVGSEAFVRQDRATLVRGGTVRARAERLCGYVGEALAAGVEPGEALMVCADPSSAARMRGVLVQACTGVRVLTARELACEVLGDARAQQALGLAFPGGRVRMLAGYESDFVVEDVKTLGTRPGRLREMLKFLYRGWTELSDEDPEWLFTVEEMDTLDFLSDELVYLGAVMEPQLSNLATKALRLDEGLGRRFAKRCVFVSDYQNLSRASQLLCQLVAGECLTVSADAQSCTEVHESYPCLEGVGDFARLNQQVEVVDLEEGLCGEGAAAPNGLRTCATAGDASAGTAETGQFLWGTPDEEAAGVADMVAEWVDDGVDPSGLAVVTFHPWWTQQLSHALGARGVAANAWFGPLKLRGDIRDLDRCLALRVVTLLRLLADPRDGVAWRSWFGFGDYLTRSNLFCEMRKGLERAGGVPAGHAGDVRRDLEAFGYDLMSDLGPLFAEVRALRGKQLLGRLTQTLAGPDTALPAVLRPLLALGPDAGAAQMVARLDELQFFAGLPDRRGVVVAPYEAVADLAFDRALFAGCMNGLFPKAAYFDLTKVSVNKQKKMGAHDAAQARAMARLGERGAWVSGFARCGRAFAERVGVRAVRIFAASDAGGEVCEATPSIYTDALLGRG